MLVDVEMLKSAIRANNNQIVNPVNNFNQVGFDGSRQATLERRNVARTEIDLQNQAITVGTASSIMGV